MFKNGNTITCKKDFIHNGHKYLKGEEFIINGYDNYRIEVMSSYGIFIIFVYEKDDILRTKSNYYWDLFYSEQDLRRLKIENIKENICLKNGKRCSVIKNFQMVDFFLSKVTNL